MSVGGLNSWSAVIVSEASATGEIQIEGAPTGKVALALGEGGAITGAESGTTDGLYKIARSGTTATAAIVFIL